LTLSSLAAFLASSAALVSSSGLSFLFVFLLLLLFFLLGLLPFLAWRGLGSGGSRLRLHLGSSMSGGAASEQRDHREGNQTAPYHFATQQDRAARPANALTAAREHEKRARLLDQSMVV